MKRKLVVTLMIETEAPDDRNLSHAVAAALDELVGDPDFREGITPYPAKVFHIQGTKVKIRKTSENTCDPPRE